MVCFYISFMFLILQVYACMMTFFVSNFFETQLISTGAFEIEFNGLYTCILYYQEYLMKENDSPESPSFVDF